MSDIKNISIEHARILFRNFEGREGKFNPPGDRNFCVILDQDKAETLKKEGWNVKLLKARDEDEQEQPYLKVSVSYKIKSPNIIVISGNNHLKYDETNLKELDGADIKNIDLIISPYEWEVNGDSGIKAYLKAAYITLVEDEFAAKYKDILNPITVDDEEDDPPFDVF